MKKMEKEYQDVKKKEQEEMVELRRLRRENRLLKQRNDLLEAESAELADRLVRGQVSRAEEEETRYVFKDIKTLPVFLLTSCHFSFAIQTELMQLRRSYLEISHQLENANEEVRGLSLRLQENVSIFRFYYFLCFPFFIKKNNLKINFSNHLFCAHTSFIHSFIIICCI